MYKYTCITYNIWVTQGRNGSHFALPSVPDTKITKILKCHFPLVYLYAKSLRSGPFRNWSLTKLLKSPFPLVHWWYEVKQRTFEKSVQYIQLFSLFSWIQVFSKTSFVLLHSSIFENMFSTSPCPLVCLQHKVTKQRTFEKSAQHKLLYEVLSPWYIYHTKSLSRGRLAKIGAAPLIGTVHAQYIYFLKSHLENVWEMGSWHELSPVIPLVYLPHLAHLPHLV